MEDGPLCDFVVLPGQRTNFLSLMKYLENARPISQLAGVESGSAAEGKRLFNPFLLFAFTNLSVNNVRNQKYGCHDDGV